MSTVWVAVADYGLNGAGVLDVFDHEPTAEEVALSENASFGGNRGIEVTQHSVRESHPTTTDDLPARLEDLYDPVQHPSVFAAAARIRELEAAGDALCDADPKPDPGDRMMQKARKAWRKAR